MRKDRRGLKFLRGRLGETQKEAAEALRLNYKTYNHYERGRRKITDLDVLLRMSEHFEAPLEEIVWHLGGNVEPEELYSSHATSTA